MKKISSYIVLLVFISAFLVSGELHADGFPSPANFDVPPPPPPGLPIDGGVLFLLISGVLLGVSKIRSGQQ